MHEINVTSYFTEENTNFFLLYQTVSLQPHTIFFLVNILFQELSNIEKSFDFTIELCFYVDFLILTMKACYHRPCN